MIKYRVKGKTKNTIIYSGKIIKPNTNINCEMSEKDFNCLKNAIDIEESFVIESQPEDLESLLHESDTIKERVKTKNSK